MYLVLVEFSFAVTSSVNSILVAQTQSSVSFSRVRYIILIAPFFCAVDVLKLT